jgi:hypothetical protein
MTNCNIHGSNCERIHTGDVVRVVGEGAGYMQYGNVVEVRDGKWFVVNFPDGVEGAAEGVDKLDFYESELEKVSV